jgi:hypothetical protein
VPRNGSADILYISEAFNGGHVSHCVCNVKKCHDSPNIRSRTTASLHLETPVTYTNIGWKRKIYTVVGPTCQQVSWLSRMNL